MPSLEPIPQPKTDPLIGNLRDIDSEVPIQGFMRMARAMGPIYQLELFGKSTIILSSHELVDEVCDETRFDKRIAGTLKNIRDFAGDGLFTAHTREPNWAIAHRLLMPAFGPIGMHGMFEQMHDIADQMLVRWERFGASTTIDVVDHMTRMTLDTIALCAFDYRFNSFYQTGLHPFVGSLFHALQEAGARSRRPAIATKLLMRTRRAYEDDIKRMNEVADALIAERRADPDAASKKDLLSLMLRGHDPITGEGLSDENIRYQMLTFLIAGHETTSGMLSFCTYFLLKNPRVLNKARAIVDEVLGNDMPRLEHLGKLRYIEQILMESLRIWPTAPAITLRARKDTTLGGRYAIKSSDTLMVLTPMLHQDPEVWGDDADQFRPERFDPEAAAKLPPNAWKPFGNGQRACIGRPFAMQESVLVVSMMLQRFDLIEADPSYRLQVAEMPSLKPEGFFIRAKRRGTSPFGPRGRVPSAPQMPIAASASARAIDREGLTPLLLLFGSNTGSAEAFAQRIAGDAAAQGYAARLAPLDDHAGQLPANGAVAIIASSYEGKPPDNARQFMAWLEGLATGGLSGVKFAVFGCGNRQWARTYQAIPKQIDSALEAAGAVRFATRGEADAGGDFFGAFDEWYAGFWKGLATALGTQAREAAAGVPLRVAPVTEGRLSILRQTDLSPGEVLANRELVDMSKPGARGKRHIEIRLPAGMTYRAGDYLSVLPHNPISNVERALRRFGFAPDSRVVLNKSDSGAGPLPMDVPVGVGELLMNYVELAQPATRAQVKALADATRCPPEKTALQALAGDAYETEVLGKRASQLDLLERFASCELEFGAFLEMLPPMRPRQYSISSSPLWNDTHCTLTIGVIDAPALSGQGRFRGTASTHLAYSGPGTHVSVAVRSSNIHFCPPPEPETPMIMVCAGTGLAPFRGFMQERAVQGAAGQKVGRSLLFFGCDRPDVDLLYRDELAAWEAAGVVSVRPAFSEAPEGEVRFVQHRLWQDRAEVAELFSAGAHVYVCGDGRFMAPAVRETCARIYREAVGASADDAEAWMDQVERETGRYVADVFA